MIYIKKVKIFVYDDYSKIEDETVLNGSIDDMNLDFSKFKITLKTGLDIFILKKETDEDLFIIKYDGVEWYSEIKLKEYDQSVLIPIKNVEYFKSENTIIIKYEIDGEESLHTIEFRY